MPEKLLVRDDVTFAEEKVLAKAETCEKIMVKKGIR